VFGLVFPSNISFQHFLLDRFQIEVNIILYTKLSIHFAWRGLEVSFGVRMPYNLISQWTIEEVDMNRKMRGLLVLVIVILAGCGNRRSEQVEIKYPERDITCIIPFGQGGGTDVWARKVMESMAKELKVSITTTNVTGGSAGSIGISQVWNSPHDGYVLAATSETPLTIPVTTPITQTSKDWDYFIAGGSPGLLCVNAATAARLGIDTLDKLVAYGNKSSLKIAGTTGGLWFALASLITEKNYGNWPLTWVSYAGSGPAILATVGGIDADLVVASAGEVKDYVRAGQLIPIAHMSPDGYVFKTDAKSIDVPAITKVIPAIAKFLPLQQWLGFKVPADTPAPVKARLTTAFKAAMADPSMIKFAEDQMAVIYNRSGAEAKTMAQKSESNLTWILFDLGKTTFSPAERGIAKP
jgi:tripartite-type tricarboxylate transporter receptor subunit TctC